MEEVAFSQEGPASLRRETFGSRLQYGVFHLLIRTRADRVVSVLLRVVVFWYVLFRPSARRRSEPYLLRRFQGIRGVRKLCATYLMDLGFGQSLIDRAAVRIVGPEAITIEFPQQGQIRELLEEKKGLIFLTAHVGGWQASMGALSFCNVPVNLLIHRDEADVDSSFFEQHGTKGTPFRIIDPAEEMGGMLTIMDALKRGELVSMMGDRVFGSSKNTVRVSFLGGFIRLPFSAYKVASVTGSPIATCFSYRIGQGRYGMIVDRITRAPSGMGRKAEAFVEYAAEFAKGLERFVEAHPHQFYNFHNMWED
jgi:predicted LPLAT superfamily acyltransferase